MLKIYFYLKSEKVNKNGECPIYARLWHDQNSVAITTRQYISPERWEYTNKLRKLLRMEKEKKIRKSLDIFQLEIKKKYDGIIFGSREFSLAEFKNELTGRITESRITVLKILENYIIHFSRKVKNDERSSDSLRKYERSKELLIEFIKANHQKNDITCESINDTFINKLELFLKNSTLKANKGIRNNSNINYISMYKTAFNYAVKSGLTDRNPFDFYDNSLRRKKTAIQS